MGSKHPFVTLLLISLFVLDVATDIATGIELILNDHHGWGYLVLALVIFPVFVSIVAELLRGCIYSGCCGEATTDWIPLIFYHLYTVIMMIGSDCNYQWEQESHYLQAIQGFLQSGPQIVLQIVIIFRGALIHSFRDTTKTLLEDGLTFEFFSDKSLGWYWGLIQVYSLVFSMLSLLQTSIHFNEWPKRRHTIHRFLLIVPFFLTTMIYRSMALALLLIFAGKMALLPIFAIITAQVITYNSLALDLPRSLAYGICSLIVPMGYTRCRDPDSQPFGLSLLPGYTNRFEGTCPGEGDRSPEQVDILRERSKCFLAMHAILGGGILGISLAIIYLLVNFTEVFNPLSAWIIFNHYTLSDSIFPFIAADYLVALVLTGLFTCCIGRCFEEEYIYPV
ncbi:uncharacterized protein LOC131883840 isoform X1 [Tigriopus californicus]|uniref:uncharacterized protein LOC131883840 isoform X1 n=1 Tax=Tigriopus californicus TaxID=6832 RepID=UPI0027DAAEA9|nr:uncharacterized protein LOC131883840 isoform X1 [Tigriopus californicus]XP_059087412.1 uncharacterized protein LOC131883840 isoform X1 [Tigriopus californicus]